MIITYNGLSSFKIQSKPTDGTTTIINPFKEEVGIKFPKNQADLILIGSSNKYINNKNSNKETFIINSPGEYDVKNTGVKGISIKGKEKNTIIYRLTIHNINFVHLSDLDRTLNTEELEELTGTDILAIPVGGNGVLNSSLAKEVINQIEPRMVIPMLYKLPSLIIDHDEIEKFTREMGLESTSEDKLRITKKDLPQEDMELVILNVKQ